MRGRRPGSGPPAAGDGVRGEAVRTTGPAPSGAGPDGRAAVAALVAILVVTAAWWSLALWPNGGDLPAWAVRTRAVCFGSGETGLPDAEGWMVLVGQPLGMLAVLGVGWRRELTRGLRSVLARPTGKVASLVLGALVALGLLTAGDRVLDARTSAEAALPAPGVDPAAVPRLDRPAPELRLVDQDGDTLRTGRLAGGPALVTFAYSHCETVCPLLTEAMLRARERLREDGVDPPIVIVTVDPWRDTPERLPSVAEKWGLGAGDRVLSGPVEQVRAVLEAWNVPVERDTLTGEVTHPALVYVLDRSGRIAFAASPAPRVVEALVRRAAVPAGAEATAGS